MELIKSSNLFESNFEDCTMLYDEQENRYFILNEVASIIWSQVFCDEYIDVTKIELIICNIYNVSKDIVHIDIYNFINTMIEKKLFFEKSS